jgi:hypothetical protein
MKAKRCENGKIEDRDRYGIIDRNNNEPQLFDVDKDGFLTREGLIITKVRNFDSDKDVIIIGGMHDYSLMAFSTNVEESLLKLSRLVGSDKWYQVFLPVALRHSPHTSNQENQWYTEAKIEWDNAEKESYS